jgi:hypothetical protein
MANSDDTVLTDLMKQTQAAVSLNPMLKPQIEQFWQAQEQMLQEAQAFTEHWFERRHDATKTALKAVEEVSDGKAGPSNALKAMSEWQRSSMERIVEDFREWVELCTRCAGHVTSAEIEAEKEGLKTATKQVTSSAKARHATPVCKP